MLARRESDPHALVTDLHPRIRFFKVAGMLGPGKELAHPLVLLGLGIGATQQVQRFAHDMADPVAWVQRGIGILKNNLNILP